MTTTTISTSKLREDIADALDAVKDGNILVVILRLQHRKEVYR